MVAKISYPSKYEIGLFRQLTVRTGADCLLDAAGHTHDARKCFLRLASAPIPSGTHL